jgi:hypothetical protein
MVYGTRINTTYLHRKGRGSLAPAFREPQRDLEFSIIIVTFYFDFCVRLETGESRGGLKLRTGSILHRRCFQASIKLSVSVLGVSLDTVDPVLYTIVASVRIVHGVTRGDGVWSVGHVVAKHLDICYCSCLF